MLSIVSFNDLKASRFQRDLHNVPNHLFVVYDQEKLFRRGYRQRTYKPIKRILTRNRIYAITFG